MGLAVVCIVGPQHESAQAISQARNDAPHKEVSAMILLTLRIVDFGGFWRTFQRERR
jgi:hypothetical protein